MKREDAIVMLRIYEIQKTQGREVYSGDLANARVLPKNKCQEKLEEFTSLGYLIESAERGANKYRVSSLGYSQMIAYRDIKIEIGA